MLDTNIVSDLVRNPTGKVAQKVAEVGQSRICFSAIVSAELRFGGFRSGSAALNRKIEAILSVVKTIAFDAPADVEYARIRHHLSTRGIIIGGNDLWIAAHAVALRLPLVTNNVREFSRVPGLVIENWLA